VGALVLLIGATLPSAPVAAHNALVSSDPADGASLPTPPTEIRWVFDRSVPLDTMTVTLIEASGVRTELPGSTHGPSGDREVITPLPALAPGEVSVRWRLVGPDGHPVSGRVDFAVLGAVAVGADATAPEAVTAPVTPSSVPATPIDDAAATEAETGTSVPSGIRWVFRFASYLAIMAVVGILLVGAFVWAGAGTAPLLRRILSVSLVSIGALAVAQLLVVASDISGEWPWSSVGSVDAALTTDAGVALAVRAVIALFMWLALFRLDLGHPDVYGAAVVLPGLALLATWAFAGHASSMRWPVAGVVTDVAHHAAAAAWIAGLAIVGWMVIPAGADDVVPVVRRFSTMAMTCVAVLVVTGLVQSARLVGSPLDLFAADHGRYLAAKLAVLVVMLVLADRNRRRLAARLDRPEAGRISGIRRGVIAEFALGMAIVGITAAMVVSPPATGESADARPAPPPAAALDTPRPSTEEST
jgi:copper transport protein